MTINPVIQLASGNYFDFLDFDKDDIRIEDIASSLSKMCRWTGQCKALYTVAQHSILVSELVPREHALEGLLHDAAEAYIGDINRPLKNLIHELKYAERAIYAEVAKKFGLPDTETPCVKEADNIALVTESRDLMPDGGGQENWEWAVDIPRLSHRIEAIENWRLVETLFLNRFYELTGGKK